MELPFWVTKLIPEPAKPAGQIKDFKQKNNILHNGSFIKC